MFLRMDKICRTCMGEPRILIPIWPIDKYRTKEEEDTYSIIRKLVLFTTIDVSTAILFDQWEIRKGIDEIYLKISFLILGNERRWFTRKGLRCLHQ